MTGWDLVRAPARARAGERRETHGVLVGEAVLDGADWSELTGLDGLGEGGFAPGVAADDTLEAAPAAELRRRFGKLYASPLAADALRAANISGLRLEPLRYTGEVDLEVSGMTDEDFDVLDFPDGED